MDNHKDFTNETEARIFRDTQRDAGLAASVFTYRPDRYRVKVWEKWPTYPERTQRALSDQAYKVSQDIEDLTKIRELIANPDFGSDIEDAVLVAKKLKKEGWFVTPNDVIRFFDFPQDELDRIKDMVKTALKEYDEDWNETHTEVKS